MLSPGMLKVSAKGRMLNRLEEAISLNDYGVADVNSETCTGCKKCIKACPMEAVSIE
jgi:ferredoxin